VGKTNCLRLVAQQKQRIWLHWSIVELEWSINITRMKQQPHAKVHFRSNTPETSSYGPCQQSKHQRNRWLEPAASLQEQASVLQLCKELRSQLNQ